MMEYPPDPVLDSTKQLGLTKPSPLGWRAAENKGMSVSNPFIAELGLLTKLLEPRVSGRKESLSLPLPKPVDQGPGGKRQSVPPLSEYEVSMGEVQSLPGYSKLLKGESSTGHAGLKEMQISRKARHEGAIEGYQKRLVTMEVELEAKTGQVARGFKQLIGLNDAELGTMFEELEDDFLIQMERSEVDGAWTRIHEELLRREKWVGDFESDLSKVESERRQRVEMELSALMGVLIETAHLLPPQLERLLEEMAHTVNLLILSNREVHADLITRLKIDEVKRQKIDLKRWQERLAKWRRLRHDHSVQSFKTYVHSPQVVAPLLQDRLLKKLREAQVPVDPPLSYSSVGSLDLLRWIPRSPPVDP